MRRVFVVATALVALAVAPAVPARADGGPGDGFQSISLSAVAGGQRILADTLAGQPAGTADTGVPDAEATMTTSTGHALASIAWPSALAGNAGSLLLLLGPNPCSPALPNLFPGQPQPPTQCSPVPIPQEVMDQYHYLNTPVRAEAVYPVQQSADNSVPGGSMTARADGLQASADAVLGAVLASDIERASTSRATSIVKLTGPTGAIADARSLVSGIEFAGGEIKIGSVESNAHGETNGTTAVSSGTTTVHDMTIHGVPVSVDAQGVHVNGQTGDAVGPAAAVVNQVLAGFGATMFVTRPTQKTDGATTTYDAGSLIIEWFPPGAPGGLVFEFGGAHITAGATLPFVFDLDQALGGATGGGTTVSGGGFDALPSLSAGGGTSPLSVGGVQDEPLQLGAAAAVTKLPGGIGFWWVLAGLVAAAVAAAALRRLPDQVLVASGTSCATGEDV
jgi:hypothetical protein